MIAFYLLDYQRNQNKFPVFKNDSAVNSEENIYLSYTL